jgi:hypothetical protein
MVDLPDDQGAVVSACNLFGLGVSQEVCWTVWIVVFALLLAVLMWMSNRDGGGHGVP